MAWYKRQEETPEAPGPDPAESRPSPAPVSPPAVEPAGRGESRIGGGLRIKGEVNGREDFRIDGQVEGKVSLGGGRITVGHAGSVSGPIDAREIIVHGAVRGNLRAAQRVEIGPTGVLDGDVAAERVHIAEGARVHGRVAAGPAPEHGKHPARPAPGGRGEKPALFTAGEAEISGQ